MRDDHSSLSAAGVAYYGFLSLIPALAATVSLYGLIATPAQVRSRIHTMFSAMPADARRLLETQLTRIAGRPGGSLTFGLLISLLVALWSASSGMAHLIEAVNMSYDERQDRTFLKRRAIALAATLVGLVVAAAAVTALAAVPNLAGHHGIGHLGLQAAMWVAVAAIAMLALAALYRFGPDRDEPEWRWVTPGSLVTLVAWVVASIGLQIYAAKFGSFNATYGALAAVILLLLWLYISALLVIVGAQINSELEHQTAKDSTVGPAQPLGTRGADKADHVAAQTD